jgi:carbon catabolite-derepressing protein kinase
MAPVLHFGESDAEVPDSFGTYDIVKQIGVGGFSAVVLVRDRITGTTYACKIVTRESLIESGTFGRFEKEVRLLEQLHHPNIVPLADCLFENNYIFVVMEYCTGGELFSYLVQHGRLCENECRRMFVDIVNGLSYIHARGIAHRDLKPENILLDESLSAKIADFGLCKIVTQGKLMMTPCGSPIYAAPEVITGLGYDGRMSDIWSLGVVLYVMATASPPWQSRNNVELFKEVAKGEFRLPNYLSPGVKALIRSMINVVATERPTIDEIANNPWVTAGDLDEFGLPIVKKAPSGELSRTPAHIENPRKVVIVRPLAITTMLSKQSLGARGRQMDGSLESLLRKVPPSGKVRNTQAVPLVKSV